MISPETLTTDYLSALHDHLMYTLEQKLGASILRTVPIEYCLTVPAIWSESAKKKTLDAATAAGMNSKKNILLVSEPVRYYLLWNDFSNILRRKQLQSTHFVV